MEEACKVLRSLDGAKKYKVGNYLLYKGANCVGKIIVENNDKYDIDYSVTNTMYYDHGINIPKSVLDRDFEICERFPLSTLRPFDRVLVRNVQVNSDQNIWRCAHFSSLETAGRIRTENFIWDECVPYNDDTKHLVGTNIDAPEFYKHY